MKKIFSVIALAATTAVFTSCSDFLDQTSPSESIAPNVYTSPYYTGLRVNKIYAGLEVDRTYSQDLALVYGVNTDCELIDGLGGTSTQASERGFMNYNATPGGWTKINDMWTDMYNVIEDANDVISGIRTYADYTSGSSDAKTMGRYLGEALTIRAMVYFDLFRIFGDIPMKMEPSRDDLSNVYLGKTDRDVIMDSLMNDLDEAIELLPWADDVSGYTTEHTTKGYAHGLLAQIAMTRAGYAIRESAKEGYETASYSDPVYPTQRPGAEERKALYERALKHWSAIISDNHHSLNPSFENEWYLLNQLTLDKTYRENLFEIPMGLNHTGELGYTIGVRLNGVTTEYGKGNSTGKVKLTSTLLYSYKDNDTRKDITCSPIEIKPENGVTQETMIGNAPFGIYVGKWDPRKMNSEWLSQNLTATDKHLTGINVVKMRYSQVLLYYAECMNELAGPDGTYTDYAGLTARQALEAVHSRAYDDEHKAEAQAYVASIPGDKDSFFDALVDENAWELAGESFRKYDLIRWNLLVEKIGEMKKTYLSQLQDGTYQEKIYFNYSNAAKTKIDQSSITWDGLPIGTSESSYDGSNDSFGKSKIGAADKQDTQAEVNLPSISSGLVGTDVNNPGEGVAVKNRYLMPIGTNTISGSNGMLSNSYGW